MQLFSKQVPPTPTKTRDSITLTSGPSNYVISGNPDRQGSFSFRRHEGCWAFNYFYNFFCLSNNKKSCHTKQKNLTTVVI
jgi:hypothetical protein